MCQRAVKHIHLIAAQLLKSGSILSTSCAFSCPIWPAIQKGSARADIISMRKCGVYGTDSGGEFQYVLQQRSILISA